MGNPWSNHFFSPVGDWRSPLDHWIGVVQNHCDDQSEQIIPSHSSKGINYPLANLEKAIEHGHL